MPEETATEIKPKSPSLFDNPISTSVIVGSVIVALSIIFAAYLLHGGVSTNTAPSGTTTAAGTQQAASAPVKVTVRSDQPTIGNANAPLTVYEFGDFQCPYCKQFYQQTYADFKSKYIDTGKVKLVFVHFPLTSIHVNAEIASEAAECANRQGQFEAYYNTLYTNSSGDGTGLDSASLKSYASQIGLNMTTFDACLDGGQAKAVVTADEAEGTSVGVTGTPSFVIGGQLVLGAVPTAQFEASVDAALKK
jgi:protein-disulfide isomerase